MRQSELIRNNKSVAEMTTPQKVKYIENQIWKYNKSLREIAKELGISYGCIRWYIDRYEIKKKDRKTAYYDALKKRGNKGFNWSGGRYKIHGHWMVYKPKHPNSNTRGYIYEHRLIMSEKLGRPLKKDEIVHHIDGNKENNKSKNLQVMTMGGRNKYHGIPIHCPKCGYKII